MRDERLRLIFTCCYPALSRGAQVALTLRLLGGLTTAEIARAFLVPEPDDGAAAQLPGRLQSARTCAPRPSVSAGSSPSSCPTSRRSWDCSRDFLLRRRQSLAG